MAKLNFTVIIERDEDGMYIASVPALPGCHTQAPSLEELYPRVKEAIELVMEEYRGEIVLNEFVGVQQMQVVV